jgi:hypothetical protein
MTDFGRQRLGVNIDHVATVRNARGSAYPDPLRAALLAEAAGADGITAHLREDRRHIRDGDIAALAAALTVPLNFECAATAEMQAIALRYRPHAVCLVPEKRDARSRHQPASERLWSNFIPGITAICMPKAALPNATRNWTGCVRAQPWHIRLGWRCMQATA